MSPIDPQRAHDALIVRLNSDRLPRGCKGIKNSVVKTGPRAFKSASLLTFGEADSDEVTKRELRVQSWTAQADGSNIDFTTTDHSWHCENEEIDKLGAFISGEASEPGRYRRVRSTSPANELIDAIESGSVEGDDLASVVGALLAQPDSVSVLAKSDPGETLATTVQHVRHKRTLDDLESLLENASVTEQQLQRVLEKDWWIFGGTYVSRSERRALTVLDQIDVPLIRSDGVLHIVELKGAYLPRLVIEHRNHRIVGPEVNAAVGQVMNYLRSLDEQRDTILTNLGVDCRRAFSSVVIGHPQWVPDMEENEVNEALRTYNSHLTRIEVITYADLLKDSRNALALQARDHLDD